MPKGHQTEKIIMESQGEFLGVEKGAFVLHDKKGYTKRYPLFEQELGEVVLKSGNSVSTGFLASACFWGIEIAVMTSKGHVVGYLKPIDDDSHVETRLAQYDAVRDSRAFEIGKLITRKKIEGQNQVLTKYGLKLCDIGELLNLNPDSDNLERFRHRITQYEAKCSRLYYRQIFGLLPEPLRPEGRRTFRAYDGMNNLFNLGYELLQWKVYRAIVKAKLEPCLGFLHSEQWGKPSLVCDLMELYRFLIDDFLIDYSRDLVGRDFVMKDETLIYRKVGKREYLNDADTKGLMKGLNDYFERYFEIPRVRIGKQQTLETLINEEAGLLAMYLRGEKKEWNPRIPTIDR
jgi:CRISP-associated protein Cas1